MNSSHFSYRSADDIATIFCSMFPDSATASQFLCGERKARYITVTEESKVQSEVQLQYPDAEHWFMSTPGGSRCIHGVDASKREASTTSLMRWVHSLFNETPARCEDYTQVTGSSVFGYNLCNTCWLENGPVAEIRLVFT